MYSYTDDTTTFTRYTFFEGCLCVCEYTAERSSSHRYFEHVPCILFQRTFFNLRVHFKLCYCSYREVYRWTPPRVQVIEFHLNITSKFCFSPRLLNASESVSEYRCNVHPLIGMKGVKWLFSNDLESVQFVWNVSSSLPNSLLDLGISIHQCSSGLKCHFVVGWIIGILLRFGWTVRRRPCCVWEAQPSWDVIISSRRWNVPLNVMYLRAFSVMRDNWVTIHK